VPRAMQAAVKGAANFRHGKAKAAFLRDLHYYYKTTKRK
jgi:hypothetical protein